MEESIDESDYEPSTYSESSEKTDWNDSESEWEDGTTGWQWLFHVIVDFRVVFLKTFKL